MTHKWIPSTLGHGDTMCEYCSITNREAAVLGVLNECDKAPAPDEEEPVRISPQSVLDIEGLHARVAELEGHVDGLQATLVACEQACWHEGQTVQGLSRDIRRLVQRFLDGKNPAQDIVVRAEQAEREAKEHEDMTESLRRNMQELIQERDKASIQSALMVNALRLASKFKDLWGQSTFALSDQWKEFERALALREEPAHAQDFLALVEAAKTLEWRCDDRGHATAVYKYQDFGALHAAIASIVWKE